MESEKEKKDIVELILDDHRAVEGTLDEFFSETVDLSTKLEHGQRAFRELALHTFLEEQFLYPELLSIGETRKYATRSIGEHRQIKEDLLVLSDAVDQAYATITSRTATSSHLDNKLFEQLQLLRSDVESHTQYEEIVVLPALQRCKPKERLLKLGRWWLDGKQHNFTLPLKQLLSNPTISSTATHQIPANLPIR